MDPNRYFQNNPFGDSALDLAHEGNTENLFSSSGRLASVKKGESTLTVQTRVAANLDVYMPPILHIWNRYKEKYSSNGTFDDEHGQ